MLPMQKGVMVETVLWTNPSSSSARSGTNTITLSQSYENFDLIKIKFKYVKSSSDVSTDPEVVKSVYITPTDLAEPQGPTLGLGRINGSNSYVASRYINSTSTTTITDVCVNSNATDTAIIISVSGINIR